MTFLHRLKREKAAYFFLLPLFTVLVLLRLRPLVQGITLAFYKVNLASRRFVGLANFRKLARDPIFWIVVKNTAFYAIVMVPVILGVSIMAAVIVNKLGRKSQSFFRGAFYLPVVTAGVIMSVVWIWIFNSEYGLLNWVLMVLGFERVLWLADPLYAKLAVCIVQLGWSLGVPLILLLSAFAAIPKTVYEAAALDGAGPFRKFFSVSLPLILPTVAYLLVILTIGRFQTFSAIILMTSGGPYYGTTSFAYRLYELGFVRFRFGEAASYGVVLLAVIFTIAFFQFRYLNRKLEF